MALTFGEGLVDELVAAYTERYPAVLEALNAEFDDSIVLRDPIAYNPYEIQPHRNIPDVPALFFKVAGLQLPQWGETYAYPEADVIVWAVDRDPDPERIARLMYRHSRALWATLVDQRFATAGATITWEPGIGASPVIDFAPTLTRGGISMAAVALATTFSTSEDE